MKIRDRSYGWRSVLAAATVAVAVVVIITIVAERAFFGDATAHPPSDGETVRIAAQRTTEGGVRVALQQHIDGAWGERQRPALSVLPAGAPVGEWRTSSALTTTAAGVPDSPLFCIVAHGARDDFFWRLLRGFSRQASIDLGINVRFTQSLDGADQAAEIDRCSTDGASVIASTLADPDAVRPSLLAAKEAGARVITFNSGPELAESVGSEMHIALDDDAAGRLAAQELNHAGITGPVDCLIHEAENVGLEARCDALESLYEGGDVTRLRLPQPAEAEQIRAAIVARLLDDAQPAPAALIALNSDTLIQAMHGVFETRDQFDHVIRVASIGLTIALDDLPADLIRAHQLFYIDAAPESQGYLTTAALQMVHNYPTPTQFLGSPLILRAEPYVYAVRAFAGSPEALALARQQIGVRLALIREKLALGDEYFE